MNFTQEIKRDLLKNIPDEQGGRALLAGLFAAGGDCREGGASFTSESEEIAAYLLGVFEQLFGVQMTLTEAVRDPKHGRDKLTFSYSGGRSEEIYDAIYTPEETEEETDIFYLRGAFLGGGSCTLPRAGKKTGYHLEVMFGDEEDAEGYLLLLDRFQIIGSMIKRGDKSVAYLKSREAISDFLSVVGAGGALGTFETVSAAREERNNENRRSNCYAGNADKTMTASAEQVLAIGKLQESGRLKLLPEPLQETAKARLENPELSLAELAEKLRLTKSGLAHRLRKILQIYKSDKTL